MLHCANFVSEVAVIAGCSLPQYQKNRFVIKAEIPAPPDSVGSLVVSDLHRDGLAVPNDYAL